MPTVKYPLHHLKDKSKIKLIDPLVSQPDQRGPSCGFYALSYVMLYWWWRAKKLKMNLGLKKPLPPRSHLTVPQAHGVGKLKKQKAQSKGSYESLRQYGKAHNLTRYGSMFNAESVAKVARGTGSQYAGQYDGKVFHIVNATALVARIVKLLDAACPVIIPFDVDDNGDPSFKFGKAAHWAVIVGSYEDTGAKYFLNFHWGEFHSCKADRMAKSCINLTSNELLELHKYEVTLPKTGEVLMRDIITEDTANYYRKNKCNLSKLSTKKLINYEYCKPEIKHLTTDDKLQMPFHGFELNKLKNAGLCANIVAVYPKKLEKVLLSALK